MRHSRRPRAGRRGRRAGFRAAQPADKIRVANQESRVGDRDQIGTWRELDSEKFNDLLLRSWVPFVTHNTVCRRQWLSSNDLRYDPRFPVSEDTDLHLRAAQGARIVFTPEILGKYRASSSGLAARSDTSALLSRHLQRYSMLQLPATRRRSAAEGGVWRRIALSECLLAEALLTDGFPWSGTCQ